MCMYKVNRMGVLELMTSAPHHTSTGQGHIMEYSGEGGEGGGLVNDITVGL